MRSCGANEALSGGWPTFELSAAIMLFTSETKVISVLIFDLKESGDLGAIAILGLSMLILTFTVIIFVNRIPGFGSTGLRNS